MPPAPATAVLRHVRQLVRPPDADVPDGELLARFVAAGDQAAFELLVWRHGAMVLGVCRRVLQDLHHAEDTFQATMLILARKAASIGRRESVAGWLYRVAYRTALRARARLARRDRHERLAARPVTAAPESAADLAWHELQTALDEEIDRLPRRYGAPVVLCVLQGLTNAEAARRLRWPVGTVKTRLARARALLGDRLTRRGLTLGAGLAAAGLSRPATAAGVPAALVAATARAALPLAAGRMLPAGLVSPRATALWKGVLHAMFLTKLKTAAALLLAVAVTGAGAGVLSYRTLAADPTGAQHAAADTVDRADPPPADKPVAYIYGDVPVTRAEFGEYLIARHRDQLQQLVNRRIIEHACRERDIAVSAAEVDAALAEDLKGMGNLSVQDFVDQWLKRYHKCLFEWKADIIRPRLLLTKLVRGRVRVTEADVRAAYEAAYGEKVECRMILWPTKSRAAARRSYDDLRASADAFERAAHQQATPALAKTGGLVTIARHGTERPELERAAFRLRPGEFGPLIETPDGFVALQCVRRVAPDPNVTLNDVRDALAAQVRSRKTQQEIATVFRELEQEARPRLLLRPQ